MVSLICIVASLVHGQFISIIYKRVTIVCAIQVPA